MLKNHKIALIIKLSNFFQPAVETFPLTIQTHIRHTFQDVCQREACSSQSQMPGCQSQLKNIDYIYNI